MNEAMREGLTIAAKRAASNNPADLDWAVRAGTLAYRRRLLRAQAAAALVVVILAGALVVAQSAAYGATTIQDGATGARTGLTASPATGIATSAATGIATSAATGIATSAATGIATSAATGIATGPLIGIATSPVTRSTSSATASLAAVLTMIQISPNPLTVPAGSQATATATGVYSDDTRKLLETLVTWSTNPQGSASVNSKGVVEGIAPSTATLTATLKGVTGTASVIVGESLARPR